MNNPSDENEATVFSPRSAELIAREDSALLIVDVQEKLLAAIDEGRQIVWNASRLARAAKQMDIPMFASEQYPERLGPTAQDLVEHIGEATGKRMFSCRECDAFVTQCQSNNIRQIVICGIESHVCVLQTALDLLAEGFSVFIVGDAVGSRGNLDHHLALRRMETCGAIVTTTESVLFEWCETSTAPEFKQISALVREEFESDS